MTKIYFNNYSTEHLGPIYKDNYIDADGLIVEVDIDLTEVNYMYVNFRVGQLSYTNDVSIVDIENNIVSVPIPTEVLKKGTHQLELVAAMNNGSVIPSRTYKYSVDESLENPNAVEAESCYPILITLIEEVTAKIDEVNDAVERVNTSIENMTNELAQYKESTTNELEESFNTYSSNTTSNITNVLDNKIAEVDSRVDEEIAQINTALNNKISEVNTSVNNKINEVDELIEEVETSEEAREEEHNQLVNELSSYSNDLNDLKDRVDIIEEEITDNEVIVDLKNKVNNHEERITTNEKAIRYHGILLKALNDLDDTITIEDEGTVISLPQSDDGKIIIDELEGNTLVNYCTNGSQELTLNNEINVQGINTITLTDTVDNGKVIINELEGNTLVNYCSNGSTELTLNNEINAEGTNVTLTDTVDNGKVDVVCEGNTLVNLANFKGSFDGREITSSKSEFIIDTTPLQQELIAGKTYSIIDCSIISDVTSLSVYSVEYTSTENLKKNLVSCLNKKVAVFTVPNDYNNYKHIYVNTNGNQVNLKLKAMILEGDWTDKEIPPYFEGMKSAFELEDNKVEIVGQSKNLFNGKLEFGWLNNGSVVSSSNYIHTPNYIKVNPDKPIVVWFESIDEFINISEYDKNKEHIKTTTTRDTPLKLQDNCCFVRVGCRGSDINLNLQIEYDVKTSYVPYATNTHSIQLSEPLRGLPNGVCDKFVKQGGKWYVERNCGELKNINNIFGHVYTYGHNLFNISENEFKGGDSSSSISNKLQFVGWYSPQVTSDYQYYITRDNNLWISLPTADEEEVLEYLKDIVIVGELKTPTYEEITDPQVITYLDTTHISTNSTIPCNMKIKNSGYNVLIKPSTQYIVAFNTDSKDGEVTIDLDGSKVTTSNDVGTVLTPAALTDNTLRLYGKGIKANNIRLLEGNKTNYVPRYFEGMKSSFELEENKIEVVSNNKNLLNPNITTYHAHIDENTGEIEFVDNGSERVTEFIKITDSGKYCMYLTRKDSWTKVFAYDANYNFINIPMQSWNTHQSLFTIPENCKYIRIQHIYGNSTNWGEMSLVKTEEVINFIPYEENKLEIQLSEPLRGLPNGVCDKFVKQGGKWYVERNCGGVTFNGEEDWKLWANYPSESYAFKLIKNETMKKMKEFKNITNAICNTFSQVLNGSIINVGSTYPHIISFLNNDDYFVQIRVRTSELPSLDVNGFKEWLSKNPTTLTYELATPTYEEITDPTLLTYLDTTHISTNSTIPCNMQIKNSGYNAIIKPSTQYTVAFDTDKSGEVTIDLGGAKTSTTNGVAAITTPSTLTDDSLRLYGEGIKVSNVRLLEGDKTNYIPSYFEGMKSCFEDKLQEDGTYKMEILSNNKSLIDWSIENLENHFKSEYDFSIEDNAIKVRSNYSKAYGFKKGFYVQKGEKYTIYVEGKKTSDCYSAMYLGGEDLTYWNPNTYILVPAGTSTNILNDSYGTKIVTMVAKKSGYINRWIIHASGESNFYWIKNIFLEKGESVSCIPSICNKIQLPLNEPLRAVGDAKDRFVLKDGKLMIERNCGLLKIKSSQGFSLAGKYNNNDLYGFERDFTGIKPILSSSKAIKCGKYPYYPYFGDTLMKNIKGEWVGTWSNNSDRIAIILRLKTKDNTLSSLNEYLSENPISIVYQSLEPTYEEVPYETQKLILECFENGTLFIDTLIPPTVSVTYSANKPIASTLNQIQTVQDEQDEMILENAVNIAVMNLTM